MERKGQKNEQRTKVRAKHFKKNCVSPEPSNKINVAESRKRVC
jgi:hypothetical protein